ncbi:hypothetical protein D3C80_1051550 [compost metagenome]
MRLVHGGGTEHDHVGAVLGDGALRLLEQAAEHHLLLALQQRLGVRAHVDRADRRQPRLQAVLLEGLAVQREPARPHGQDAELVAEHAGQVEGALPRRQHRDAQARTQGGQAGVADGVDAQRIETLRLGLQAGGDHRLLHDRHVVVAVGQGQHLAGADEADLDVRADQPRRQLRLHQRAGRLAHRHREDHLDALAHRGGAPYRPSSWRGRVRVSISAYMIFFAQGIRSGT